MRRTVAVVVVLLTLPLASAAQAAPLLISNISGQWQNPVMDPSGGQANADATVLILNQGGQANDQLRWGVQPSGVLIGSAFNMDPVDNPVPLQNTLNIPFTLASFSHENQPVNFNLASAEYAFSFSTNGIPGTVSQTFLFSYNETTNIVTLSNVGFAQGILVPGSGGDVYVFNLLGFSLTGAPGTFTNQFISPEGTTNRLDLWASVTTQGTPSDVVPEPASLLLLGTGLALAIRRARKHTA